MLKNRIKTYRDDFVARIPAWLDFLKPWSLLILVGLIALCLYTFKLGNLPFADYDEAAYAEVIRETAMSQNPFTFKFANEPWFDKPPFYFWAAMTTEKILHPFSSMSSGVTDSTGRMHPTEFATRLPSALGGVASVILVWLIVFQQTRNKKVATGAALILLATGSFIDNARQVRLDVPVAAAILFTYYSYLRAGGDRRWTMGVWIGLATGIMIKSVIGLLAIPVILIDLLVTDGARGLTNKLSEFFKGTYAKRGMLVAAIMVIPWHLYQTLLYGADFWNHYLFVHVFERFETNLFVDNITFGQFLNWIIFGSMPWGLMFMFSFALVFIPNFFQDRIRYRTFVISLISATCISIFFALSKTKAPSYLMPMYPFLAISMSISIEAAYKYYFKEHHLKHDATVVMATIAAVLVLISVASSIGVGLLKQGPLSDTYAYAAEEKMIGTRIRSSSDMTTVHYTVNDKWETVRFYSAGKPIQMFDSSTSTLGTNDYYIVTPRKQLADTLHSPAIKFAGNFSVKYMGTYLTLIEVKNRPLLAATSTRPIYSALVY